MLLCQDQSLNAGVRVFGVVVLQFACLELKGTGVRVCSGFLCTHVGGTVKPCGTARQPLA
jgi:hypothetical protein